ncbi:MAG: hypothetical protein JXR76_07545 [Deltaproteobacteria bacterium]|nr:hypothetical protein [Deltaproteobacteria bacterium]
MNIATAMAIAGAAVDVNTCMTRNRALSFIMTVLNLRLGYWTANPAGNRRMPRLFAAKLNTCQILKIRVLKMNGKF